MYLTKVSSGFIPSSVVKWENEKMTLKKKKGIIHIHISSNIWKKYKGART